MFSILNREYPWNFFHRVFLFKLYKTRKLKNVWSNPRNFRTGNDLWRKNPSIFQKKIVIPRKILRMGGIKTKYHRHNGVSVGWVTSFVGEYFFFLGWVFFRPKKNISPEKKNITNKRSYHPTETPLCLWYFVFMPPILKIVRGITIFFEKYWGFFVTNHYPYENFRGYFKNFCHEARVALF